MELALSLVAMPRVPSGVLSLSASATHVNSANATSVLLTDSLMLKFGESGSVEQTTRASIAHCTDEGQFVSVWMCRTPEATDQQSGQGSCVQVCERVPSFIVSG